MDSTKKKIGYTQGVFDLLHEGHLNFINRCKEGCDELWVGIQSDDFATRYKRKPLLRTHERVEQMKKLGVKVIVYDDPQSTEGLERVKPNVFFYGGEYRKEMDRTQIFLWAYRNNCQARMISRTEGVSSSEIKLRVIKMNQEFIESGFKAISEIDARLGGAYFKTSPIYPHYGTLLGIVRENGIVEGDSDLDFGIAIPTKDYRLAQRQLRELIWFLKGEGYLSKVFTGNGSTWIWENEINSKEDIVDPTGQMWLKHPYGVMDLWVDWDKGGLICNGAFGFEMMADREMQEFAGIKFELPFSSEELFIKTYGEDWRTPQSKKRADGLKTKFFVQGE